MKVGLYLLLLVVTHPVITLVWFADNTAIPVLFYILYYLVSSIVNFFLGLTYYRLSSFNILQRWSLKRWLSFATGILLWASAWIFNLILLFTIGFFFNS